MASLINYKGQEVPLVTLSEFLVQEDQTLNIIVGIVIEAPTGFRRTQKGQEQLLIRVRDEIGTPLKVNIFVFPDKSSLIGPINLGDVLVVCGKKVTIGSEIIMSAALPMHCIAVGRRDKWPVWSSNIDDSIPIMLYTKKRVYELFNWWRNIGSTLSYNINHKFINAGYNKNPMMKNNVQNDSTALSPFKNRNKNYNNQSISNHKNDPSKNSITFPELKIADVAVVGFTNYFCINAKIIHLEQNGKRLKVYLWDGTGNRVLSTEANSFYNSADEIQKTGLYEDSKEIPEFGAIVPLVLWSENKNNFFDSDLQVGDWIHLLQLRCKVQYTKYEFSLPHGVLFSIAYQKIPSMDNQFNAQDDTNPAFELIPRITSKISKKVPDILDALPIISEVTSLHNHSVSTIEDVVKEMHQTKVFKINAQIHAIWPSSPETLTSEYCLNCSEHICYSNEALSKCQSCNSEKINCEYNFQLILKDSTKTFIAVNVIGKDAKFFLQDFFPSLISENKLESLKIFDKITGIIDRPHTLEACIYSYDNMWHTHPRKSLRLFDTRLRV